jgi:hypothetical protein
MSVRLGAGLPPAHQRIMPAQGLAGKRSKKTNRMRLTQDDVQSRWGENMKNILPCMRLLFWCSQQQHKCHSGALWCYCTTGTPLMCSSIGVLLVCGRAN